MGAQSTMADVDRRVPRWLGLAFLVVIATSLVSGLLINGAVGTGGMAEALAKIAADPGPIRLGVVLGLATSLGVIVLAVLLFTVLRGQAPVLALVALGWWLGEALVLAVARVSDAALIPLGQTFVAAGSPEGSPLLALGTFIRDGLDKGLGSTTHMLFYCVGGLIWYGLLLRSNYIPRVIAAFGVAAAGLGLAGIIADLLGATVPMAVYVPLLPFELSIGLWLVAKGIRTAEA